MGFTAFRMKSTVRRCRKPPAQTSPKRSTRTTSIRWRSSRAPFPAEFGGQRTGAVINIVSKRDVDIPNGSTTTCSPAGSARRMRCRARSRRPRGLERPTCFLTATSSRRVEVSTRRPRTRFTTMPVLSDAFFRTITHLGPRDTLGLRLLKPVQHLSDSHQHDADAVRPDRQRAAARRRSARIQQFRQLELHPHLGRRNELRTSDPVVSLRPRRLCWRSRE